jgi:hypothetical protein
MVGFGNKLKRNTTTDCANYTDTRFPPIRANPRNPRFENLFLILPK